MFIKYSEEVLPQVVTEICLSWYIISHTSGCILHFVCSDLCLGIRRYLYVYFNRLIAEVHISEEHQFWKRNTNILTLCLNI